MEAIPSMNGHTSLLDLLSQILSQYGLTAMILVLIIMFGGLMFWRVIGIVCGEGLRAAAKAKDAQIERLTKDRDRCQDLLFELLRMSEGKVVQEGAKGQNGRSGTPGAREE